MDDTPLTQDAAIKLVESIGSTLGLERVNDASGVSYYAITQDTAVRISDHSTHLQTWVDKGTYTKKNKYSIVIEVNPSKPVLAVQPGIGTFVVTEFKHKLRGLSDDAVLVLANAIKGAVGTGGQFSNPLRVKPKMLASTQLNESKTNKNMKKNIVKINENTLRQIVAESVKKVLKESCWYGDEKPFQTIISAANEIVDKFDYTQDDNYDDIGDCDGPDITPQIYKWAKNVAEGAEYWLIYNSRYTPINGGEDW